MKVHKAQIYGTRKARITLIDQHWSINTVYDESIASNRVDSIYPLLCRSGFLLINPYNSTRWRWTSVGNTGIRSQKCTYTWKKNWLAIWCSKYSKNGEWDGQHIVYLHDFPPDGRRPTSRLATAAEYILSNNLYICYVRNNTGLFTDHWNIPTSVNIFF